MSEIDITVGNEIISPEKLAVGRNTSLSDVMRLIDTHETGMVIVTNEDQKIIGLATDGDIRRAIINGAKISTPIREIMNENPLFISLDTSLNLQGDELIRFIRSKIFKKTFLKELTKRIRNTVNIPFIDGSSKKLIGAISVYVTEREVSQEFLKYKVKTENLVGGVKSVLVIGGGGYVGTKLVNILASEGKEVRILDNFLWGKDTKDIWDDNPNVEVIEGDMQHIETIVEVMKGVDAVCHLAALVGDPACDLDFPTTLATNYLSTIQI